MRKTHAIDFCLHSHVHPCTHVPTHSCAHVHTHTYNERETDREKDRQTRDLMSTAVRKSERFSMSKNRLVHGLFEAKRLAKAK